MKAKQKEIWKDRNQKYNKTGTTKRLSNDTMKKFSIYSRKNETFDKSLNRLLAEVFSLRAKKKIRKDEGDGFPIPRL